jgi:MFS family permease
MRLHPVLPKALYFCFFGAWALSAPFTSVFLSTLVPESFVGWSLGLMFMAALIFAPMWGLVADFLDRPRFVFAALMTVGFGVRWGGAFFLTRDVSPFVASGVFIGSEMIFCGATPILDALVCKMLKPGEEFGHQVCASNWNAVLLTPPRTRDCGAQLRGELRRQLRGCYTSALRCAGAC